MKSRIYATLVIPVFYTAASVGDCETRTKDKFHSALEMLVKKDSRCLSETITNEETGISLNRGEGKLHVKIQQRRLTWFGHQERMEDNRIPHTVLHCYIIGNRSRGRQSKTWMDSVTEDLQMHNIQGGPKTVSPY